MPIFLWCKRYIISKQEGLNKVLFSYKKILAFIWIVILIILTTYMIIKLKKVNKLSSNLLISYNIRQVLASILNIIEIFR